MTPTPTRDGPQGLTGHRGGAPAWRPAERRPGYRSGRRDGGPRTSFLRAPHLGVRWQSWGSLLSSFKPHAVALEKRGCGVRVARPNPQRPEPVGLRGSLSRVKKPNSCEVMKR